MYVTSPVCQRGQFFYCNEFWKSKRKITFWRCGRTWRFSFMGLLRLGLTKIFLKILFLQTEYIIGKHILPVRVSLAFRIKKIAKIFCSCWTMEYSMSLYPLRKLERNIHL